MRCLAVHQERSYKELFQVLTEIWREKLLHECGKGTPRNPDSGGSIQIYLLQKNGPSHFSSTFMLCCCWWGPNYELWLKDTSSARRVASCFPWGSTEMTSQTGGAISTSWTLQNTVQVTCPSEQKKGSKSVSTGKKEEKALHTQNESEWVCPFGNAHQGTALNFTLSMCKEIAGNSGCLCYSCEVAVPIISFIY